MTLFSKSVMFDGSHVALAAVNLGGSSRSTGIYRIRISVPHAQRRVHVLAVV
jgi:hypothetical protein